MTGISGPWIGRTAQRDDKNADQRRSGSAPAPDPGAGAARPIRTRWSYRADGGQPFGLSRDQVRPGRLGLPVVPDLPVERSGPVVVDGREYRTTRRAPWPRHRHRDRATPASPPRPSPPPGGRLWAGTGGPDRPHASSAVEQPGVEHQLLGLAAAHVPQQLDGHRRETPPPP